jgi:hypothetical protein
MYASLTPSLIGQPWDHWQDAKLAQDCGCGCDLFTLAARARRTKVEVLERLQQLGLEVRPGAARVPG